MKTETTRVKKTKKEKDEYHVLCNYPHCKKFIVGNSVKQVLYNLDVHIRQKHMDTRKKTEIIEK